MRKLLFIPLLIIAVLTSCEKDPDPGKTANVTPEMAKDSLYYIMKDWYYWYNQMPDVNKDSYSDPFKLMDAMRYPSLDRWSFVADYDEFIAEMQGNFVGHGFRLGVDDAGKARIAMIYNNSALYASGVRRGWIVKTINGQDIAAALLSGDEAAYNNIIGPSTGGITNIFVFTKPDGTDVTISATKSSFQVNTVLAADTLHLKNGIAGHLVFESFITPSSAELKTAFTKFKNAGITDLVLDLRYNGGGYLDIARELASYIGGNGLAGKVFAKLQYNDKHTQVNKPYNFISTSYSVTLPRVVVITTRGTASASEAVMNGLKPFVQVVSIGDTTNGKPAGMNGWDIGQKYFMWPVTFKMVNADNQGEYFDGIAPLKTAPDDITHDFSDRREACLREAVRYLETGSFTKGNLDFRNNPQFSEKPGWTGNAFTKPE